MLINSPTLVIPNNANNPVRVRSQTSRMNSSSSPQSDGSRRCLSLIGLVTVFVAFFFSSSAPAAEPTPTDLSSNLTYIRVHSLADAASTLPKTLSGKRAFVLDLRYATATDESLAILRTALAGHPADAPLFILISPATPADVIDLLNPTSAAFITLGIAGSHPAPRIIIKAEPETDRRAYDAFETGTPIKDLISGKIDKDRFDEAALVHEFKNGSPSSDPELTAATDPAGAKPAVTANKSDEPVASVTEPLKDRVLQRALNLYQALQALRSRK